MQFLAITGLALMLMSCGSSKENDDSQTEQSATNSTNDPIQAKVSLTPPPDTYTSGVVVLFKENDEDYRYEVRQADGSWSSVLDSCDGGVEGTGYSCLTINETNTITYRIKKFLEDEYSEYTADYIISPVQKNADINDVTYDESETQCAVTQTSGKTKLSFRIKLQNETTLPSKYAYIIGQISDVRNINIDLSISGSDAGLTIAGSGDDAPSYPDYYPGASSQAENDACSVKLTKFEAGQSASGAISCVTSINMFSDKLLGETVTFQNVEWACDQWVPYL